MTYKVIVENVSKSFDTKQNNFSKIFSLFYKRENKKSKHFFALKDVSFKVNQGDSVGIIGLNGSGKSTLTDLIAGVTQPTSGKIDVNGTVSLIAISAGLESELTGKENIRYKCMMHGLNNKRIDEIFDDIVEFSELGDFINQPLRTYSSGMRSKLGFSIAIHIDPDILIVDEALSVGDKTFSNKSLESIKKFQKQGKTIFFVSHSTSITKSMCNKAIWLHFGEVRSSGNIESLISEYDAFVEGFNQLSKQEQMEFRDKMLESQHSFNTYSKKDSVIKKSKNRMTLTLMFYLLFILATLYHTWVIL